ncbi:uncharacterized protein LOC144912644 [Branchiostoma floridae x Branchiostoma belcheri]
MCKFRDRFLEGNIATSATALVQDCDEICLLLPVVAGWQSSKKMEAKSPQLYSQNRALQQGLTVQVLQQYMRWEGGDTVMDVGWARGTSAGTSPNSQGSLLWWALISLLISSVMPVSATRPQTLSTT